MFPLLPSYVAMTLRSENSRMQIFFSSLALIAGVMTIFLVIGQFLNLVGSYLLANYTTFARIQGGILILAGVLLIYTPSFIQQITLPQGLQDRMYREDNRNPLIFGYLIGLLFTIIAVPCAAGYFLAVWGNMVGESFLGQFIIVLSFGIGVGIPFMMMSLFVPEVRGEMIQKMHSATKRISQILGVILIAVGIWLLFSLTPTSSSFLS
jgi:cytochrome c-type biogenesis protein